MNLLLADSGSTKTEWTLICPGSESITVHSAGLNPWYLTDDEIAGEIIEQVLPEIPSPDRIIFYGSGCTGGEMNMRMTRALKKSCGVIPVEVHSDLLGSARALFGSRPGIACILGTGSNSCHFDGHQIVDQVPALGFILGDEGSAGWFGRKILQCYFYREMPDELCLWLERHHDMSRKTILEKVYRHPVHSAFVASFTLLFSEFPDHPFVVNLLRNGFGEFFERHIMKYDPAGHSPTVGFVGSVGWNHQQIITSILTQIGFVPGRFLRTPMEGLRRYHAKEHA